MDYLPDAEELKRDPRTLTVEIQGEEFSFFLGPLGLMLARGHGLDADEIDDDADPVGTLMRTLWVAHLPFSPDMTLGRFVARFALADMEAALAIMIALRKRGQLAAAPEAANAAKTNGNAAKANGNGAAKKKRRQPVI